MLPSLQLIVTTSAGLNHIDLHACRRRGISVASAGTLYSEDVADLARGLLIDVLRNIYAADRYVRQGSWFTEGDFPLGFKLRCSQVGIVGLGSIGLKVAKKAGGLCLQYLIQLKEQEAKRILSVLFKCASTCS